MEATWDDVVTLIGTATEGEDSLGQRTRTEVRAQVCCCRRPVSRHEFYLAGQSDIRVSELLVVHPYEYAGQNTVEYNGRRLDVIKTYPLSAEELELTCTEKLGYRNGN